MEKPARTLSWRGEKTTGPNLPGFMQRPIPEERRSPTRPDPWSPPARVSTIESRPSSAAPPSSGPRPSRPQQPPLLDPSPAAAPLLRPASARQPTAPSKPPPPLIAGPVLTLRLISVVMSGTSLDEQPDGGGPLVMSHKGPVNGSNIQQKLISLDNCWCASRHDDRAMAAASGREPHRPLSPLVGLLGSLVLHCSGPLSVRLAPPLARSSICASRCVSLRDGGETCSRRPMPPLLL